MKILVTGCGRAGTQYAARLLSACGLRAGHETVHNLSLDPHGIPLDLPERWAGRDADVSWLAAPFLECQPPRVAVWHQLRDPLRVVQCWRSHDLLTLAKRHAGRWAQMVVKCDEGTPLERAVNYVLGWTALVRRARPQRTYRLESLTPALLADMLAEAGFDCDTEAAFASVQPGTGGCPPDMHIPTTWGEILEVPGGRELYEQSVRLGYGEG